MTVVKKGPGRPRVKDRRMAATFMVGSMKYIKVVREFGKKFVDQKLEEVVEDLMTHINNNR
jgi:hypothetical protein